MISLRRKKDLTCQELVELVTDYLDGTLPRRDRTRFDAHIADCGNCVAYFENGALVATYATGGLGTGSGLGSQSAVTVSHDLLFAVNAGSDSISEFQVKRDELRLLRVFPSNGVRPISVTVHDDVLY